jgi:GT2 family glycosyltransferase
MKQTMKITNTINRTRKEPLVAIVIFNWNGGQKIIDCLTSVKKTTYQNYKIILVDNHSTNDSIQELHKIQPKMSVIRLDDNYGYTIGTNVGWRYGLNTLHAEYICAMDSDIVTVDQNWLTTVIGELEQKKERGIACAKLVFPDNRVQMLYYERNRPHYQEQDIGQYDFVREVKGVGGACIVIKRSVIEKIGYYDENFFYGPNDLDYCFRARKAGFKVVYVGTAKAVHIGAPHILPQIEQRYIFHKAKEIRYLL